MSAEKQQYDFALNLGYPLNAHRLQLSMVPQKSHVLDVGCHTGILGEVLKKEKGCSVTGLDQDPQALAVASGRLDHTLSSDIEQQGWSRDVQRVDPQPFDVAVFGDVLEHTREPATILKETRELLKPGGKIVVSLPNVANLRVRLALLRGEFEYRDSGILDRTHLRFFTFRSARALLEGCGYRIVEVQPAAYQLPVWLVKRFSTMLAVQIVMLAEKV